MSGASGRLPPGRRVCLWSNFLHHRQLFTFTIVWSFSVSMAAYVNLTLDQLKEELRKRKAKVSGRKAELIERLNAYDRNSNFGQPEVIQPEYKMQLPPLATDYKDLHADQPLPVLVLEDVMNFLGLMQKSLDEKAKELYTNKYVNFVRVCTKHESSTFIHAEVRAEMKLHVTYKVDINFSEHAIHECQCECAAGMGPDAHCKHVACVLFGITEFCKTKNFLTLTTCTDKLQSFHQVKKHLGSPVKSECLLLHKSRLDSADFDPRPPAMRGDPLYGDYFQRVVVNSQVFGDAAIIQTIPPANPYAVAHDHDYLSETAETIFLKMSGLQDVNDEYIMRLERNTVSNTKLWKDERRKRLCSSDFGNICKLTDRADKLKLCNRLISGREVRTAPLLYGKKHESVALQRYAHLRNIEVDKCGLFVSKTHPFLASTPDGQVGRELLVEVKCPFSAKDKKISPTTVPFLEIKDGNLSLKTNHDYFYQIQGQMFCVGERICSVDFVVFTLCDIAIISVKRDDEFIIQMVKQLESFLVTITEMLSLKITCTETTVSISVNKQNKSAGNIYI